MRREGARLGLAPSGRSEVRAAEATAPAAGPTPAEGPGERLLLILRAEGRPLTVRQIARCAGVPLDEAAAALEGLCAAGSVRRLNTVVETYTARFL